MSDWADELRELRDLELYAATQATYYRRLTAAAVASAERDRREASAIHEARYDLTRLGERMMLAVQHVQPHVPTLVGARMAMIELD